MEAGERKFAVIPRDRNVLICEVQLLYRLRGFWHCIDPHTTLVQGRKKVWHPTYEIEDSALFDTEDEAIDDATGRGTYGGQHGRRDEDEDADEDEDEYDETPKRKGGRRKK